MPNDHQSTRSLMPAWLPRANRLVFHRVQLSRRMGVLVCDIVA